MAMHDITEIARIFTPEQIAELEASQDIQVRGDTVLAWGRRSETKVRNLAEDIKAEKAAAEQAKAEADSGIAQGVWRKAGGMWLVEADAEVGQQVRVTRRDGTSQIMTVTAVYNGGLLGVTDPALPAPRATIADDRLVYITEECPAIYGAHLLGYEGTRVTRRFRATGRH